ncbi:MAG: hypothetical protein QOK11_3296 [Pseudonocardiales bacterium]|nr:hypothetical protein [Pseudonocardiales bacterium]
MTACARTSSEGQQVWIRGISSAQLAALVRRMRSGAGASSAGVAQWALVSAALSPLLLVTGWTIAGAVQPADYSPVRQTVSVLAGHGGTHRWIMTCALVAVGCCHLLTAAGMSVLRPSARLGLVIAGLAAFGVAASPEPAHGSTSQHLAFTAVGAVAIAVWPAFATVREWSGGGVLSPRGSALATVAFVVLLIWLVAETRDMGWLGLAERASSAIQTSWPLVVGLTARRAALGDYQLVAT